MTQEERLLRHLKDRGSISTMEAFSEYGITRLASRIFDLKAKGYRIADKMESKKNRYGETVSFKRYRLEGEE